MFKVEHPVKQLIYENYYHSYCKFKQPSPLKSINRVCELLFCNLKY